MNRIGTIIREKLAAPMRYYQARQNKKSGEIEIWDQRQPHALDPVMIQRGWVDKNLRESLLDDAAKPEAIDNTGHTYILRDGTFSPVRPDGTFSPEVQPGAPLKDLRGQIIGLVRQYDDDGKEIAEPFVADLGRYIYLDRVARTNATIEISRVKRGKKGKPYLKVAERRMETTGMFVDKSKFISTLTPAGIAYIEKRIGKIERANELITKVEIRRHAKVKRVWEAEVTFAVPQEVAGKPNATKEEKLVLLAPSIRRDGHRLMTHPGMREEGDFYQSDLYTEQTAEFQPTIDIMPFKDGQPRLVQHKTNTQYLVESKELTAALDAKIVPGAHVKIFPTVATAAAKFNGKWYPVATEEPLSHMSDIDLYFSMMLHGQIKSSETAQSRFGNEGELSGEYPRDPYFYGIVALMRLNELMHCGEHVALNRAKCLRALSAIQSGRTHTEDAKVLFSELFMDIIETNNPYSSKLSNYGHQFSGAGVSEDTQLEIVGRLLGIRMWVMNEMMTRMAAEKGWGKYQVQNAIRYIFSETLFVKPFRMVLDDIFTGRFMGKKPTLMKKWGAMAEIAAGRGWYKYIWAKFVEDGAIPTFLGSFGHVLWFPVSLTLFMSAWAARTVFASVTYGLHLISLGYSPLSTGFWKNIAIEYTFSKRYFISSMSQRVYGDQFAPFAMTIGGAGKPTDSQKLLRMIVLGKAAAIVLSTLALLLVGHAAWLALPAALPALVFGRILAKKGQAVAGATLTLASAAVAVWAIAALPANLLSLAIIANLSFGIYSMALKLKSLWYIEREKTPKAVVPLWKNTLLRLLNPDYKRGEAVKDISQIRLSKLQQDNPAVYDGYKKICNNVMRYRERLTPKLLMDYREEISQFLIGFGSMDPVTRRVSLSWNNRYRDISNMMLQTSTMLETMIVFTAEDELARDYTNQQAVERLRLLAETCNEPVLIERMRKTYYKYQIETQRQAA